MRPVQTPSVLAGARTDEGPLLTVRELRAHFRTRHFGVNRHVRAVDGITFDVRRGEIYGLAGEWRDM